MMPHRRGQAPVEMAILVAVVVAGLLAMQVYARRSVSGRMRQAADSLGASYVPGKTTSHETTTTTIHTTEVLEEQESDVGGDSSHAGTSGVGAGPVTTEELSHTVQDILDEGVDPAQLNDPNVQQAIQDAVTSAISNGVSPDQAGAAIQQGIDRAAGHGAPLSPEIQQQVDDAVRAAVEHAVANAPHGSGPGSDVAGTVGIHVPRSFLSTSQVSTRTERTFDETVEINPKAKLFN